jgi:uridylate kinase
MTARYGRVLIKLSGETFCKPGHRGIDVDETRLIASEIAEASISAQCGVVVGGGNIIRGSEIAQHGIQAVTGDYMGMLATVINALALQDVLEGQGVQTRVMTALSIHAVAEPFIRRRAIRHLEKGRVVILAAGTGNPHVTTDTAAALKGKEIKAEVLLKATTKVDGVYDADPLRHPQAKRYRQISYLDVINRDLRIMDVTAISMCMQLNLPILVFNVKQHGSLARVVRGEPIGTLISEASTVTA